MTICVAFIAAAFAMAADRTRAADDTKATQEKERQLIAVLQSDAPPQDKAITCKRLAIYGSGEAAPALGALLSDEQLASWARIALEAIPDPAADEALRQAMGKLNGRLLIGVLNSIGVRRDAQAVDGLAQHLKHADADVASAAAVALGRIGNDTAARTLEQSLTDAPAPVRSAVAEGCILCAERLLSEGKASEAAKLYDKVRAADVPKQRILEATRGAILARQSAGVPLLVEQLESDDKGLFAMGLSTSREVPGRDVTEALVTVMGKATPQRQRLLILALADRSDAAVLPAVLQVADNGRNRDVRIVALQVLKRVGNASCVAALLDVALEVDEELTQAAKAALEELPGQEVDADLAARLPQADGKMRHVLIELAGRRRIAAATDALLEAADDSSAQIRSAALTALGETVGPGDLSFLIRRVVAPQKTDDQQVAQQALRAACVRMPDREACAEQLAAAMARAPVSAKCSLVEILGVMGGTNALETVAAAAKHPHPDLQDTASRLLGQWMTADAAPVLLDLADSAPETKYQIRALRGYIRIARQFDLPIQQRAQMCRAALQTAKRDAEKTLVLEVLERYPSVEMLELAVDTAKVPALKNSATKTSLVIAQKIGAKSDAVQKLLAQVGLERMKVEIIKAEYGAGSRSKDVTNLIRKHVRDLPLVVLPSSNYNASFGGDPAPGTPKRLKIWYRINGQTGEVSLPENATVILPMPATR